MYVAKVYLNYQLVDVSHYEDYEHFLSDLVSKGSDLYDRIPKEKVTETAFDRPEICPCSEDSLGFGSDIEYRYDSGVTVYCGTVITAEELARSDAHGE
ncbi:hypothetical protein [uncultured Bacteroides sp.]|uniref:hypothetical protein n=1 Tax=uncultured Bacteroides sp. TaxID=162156 RepID=UPI00259547E0|nr:hypothetical protein [uncultured Bacteroides sp.]